MTEDEQQKLTVMMVELSSKVQILLDKQDELAENINKIKEAVYNPDNGLYARLRVLEEESKNRGKFLWLLLSMGIGSIGAAVISHLQ